MQKSTPSDFSTNQLQQIDDICNSYERALQQNQSPTLEDFLSKADDGIKRALLQELVKLELHYRPEVTIAERSDCFPEWGTTWANDLSVEAGNENFPAIPGYRLIEELGRGGMGVVYRAADLHLHRHVALKMIHGAGQSNPEHRRRFLGEARAAAHLHHPNLVQIFDSGEFEGHPFLVFELIEGGTLADQIKDRPLPSRDAAELLKHLCHALQFAHDRQIIHRDLKPSNILLGANGHPQISDFGLAKRLNDEAQQTLSGLIVGTPSYMAPEQADGLSGASSPAVDIYSLGAILYELLVGEPPFKAASIMETLELLRTKDPVPPRALASNIPRDLQTICLKCLRKEPARRYASAQIVAEELDRFLQGESILASPAGAIERGGRWCLRHPLTAGLIVTLGMVIAIGFVLLSWQWQEAISQRELAESNAANFRRERDKAIAATALAEEKSAETEAERAIAERNLTAAADRFVKAQSSLRELVILGADLTRQPGMESRGLKALQQAADFGRALWEDRSPDPEVRIMTARVLQRLATVQKEYTEIGYAEDSYRQAIDVLESVLVDVPDHAECRHHLAVVYPYLASTLAAQSCPDDAEQAAEKGVKFGEQLIAEFPNDVEMHNTLAAALSIWGNTLRRRGDTSGHRAALFRSLSLRRKVVQDAPHHGGYRSNLANSLCNVASVLRTEEPAVAQQLVEEGVEIRRGEYSRKRSPRAAAVSLMAGLRQLAAIYVIADDRNEAADLLTEAITVGRAVRLSFNTYRSGRIGYLCSMKEARSLALQRNDTATADQLLQELRSEAESAREKFPKDDWLKRHDGWLRFCEGRVLLRQGKTAEAIAMLVNALDLLKSDQARSSNPNEFDADIAITANTILKTGESFEFEAAKIAARSAIADANSKSKN
ncbi:MAG: serine/threonine-protein kinase [Fuerstiella sp.]